MVKSQPILRYILRGIPAIAVAVLLSACSTTNTARNMHSETHAVGSGDLSSLQASQDEFEKMVSNLDVLDAMEGGLARLDAALQSHQPDWVLIELGANDGLRGLPPKLTRQNLDLMLQQLKTRGIHAILRGVSGKITVNGKEYNSVMPAVALNDEQTANVLTYILNSWGNAGGQVTPAEVATERKAK